MSSPEIQKVVHLLREITGNSALSEQSALLGESLIDSFDIITLVERLEESFAVTISADDMVPDNFDTVEHIVHLVSSHKPA